MKAWRKAAIIAAIATGILVPTVVIANASFTNRGPAVFEVDPYDPVAWDWTTPHDLITITWNATETEPWGGGVVTSYFLFYRLALDEAELELDLGVPLFTDGGISKIFVHSQRYVFEGHIAGDGTRIVFYRGDGWYMNKWPIDSLSFSEMHVDRIVSTIVERYGGVVA